MMFGHSFIVLANCPSNVEFDVLEYNKKSQTLLVGTKQSSTFQKVLNKDEKTLVTAYLFKFTLAKPSEAIKLVEESYNSDLYGKTLLKKYQSSLQKEKELGFNKDKLVFLENEIIARDKYEDAKKVKIKDIRLKEGSFILEKHFFEKTSKNKVSLNHQKSGKSLLLNPNIFKGTPYNQSGIMFSNKIFFVESYIAGLASYCGKPMMWSYKLSHPYKLINK